MNIRGLKQIGKGAFSTCYKKNSNKVLIKSKDPIKECMSYGEFPNSINFPLVTHVGSLNEPAMRCRYNIYEMKYYEKVKSLKNSLRPAEYRKYQDLRKVFFNTNNRLNNPSAILKDFKKLLNKYVSSKTLIKNILEAYEVCLAYDESVKFEISPRNVAATPGGTLILLDCFYSHRLLLEQKFSKKT